MARAPVTVAVTSTLAMVRTAEARGVQTEDVLLAAGLAGGSLEDPDARLPGAAVIAIWNELRRRTADPALQLVAPTSLPFGAYRIIDFLVAASATVGDGVRRFSDFFGLIADTIALTVEETDDGYALELEMAEGAPVAPVYVDYVYAALVSRIRMRIRPALQVARVELRQPEPPDAAPYAAVFRAPVRFAADADRLCFTREEWNAPTDTADSALAELLEEHARILANRLPSASSPFITALRTAVAAGLADGPSEDDVARVLHMSVRTLQRRLTAEGTTFRDVLDTVRAQLAQEYLRDHRVAIVEVALMLGFSDQSAFNRAFRRWTGHAPGRWRRGRRRITPPHLPPTGTSGP